METLRQKMNMPEVSIAEQIRRMEEAEAILQQQAAEEIEPAAVEQPPAATELDPIEAAINALRQFQWLQAQLESSVAREVQLQADNQLLKTQCEERADLIKQQYTAATKITEQRNHYRSECEQLLKKHNTEVDKANGAITKLQAQLNASRNEVKELKALNPDRLQKQVKRLQERNRELNDNNTALREQVSINRKAGKALIEIKARNEQLEHDKGRLQQALDNAVDDLNKGHQPKHVEEVDGWKVYGSTQSDDVLVIVDPQTGIERPYHRIHGMRKARPVPPAIIKRMDTLFKRMDVIKEHFDIDVPEEAEAAEV